MAGVDKLLKTLENLKVFQPESEDANARKKSEPLTVKDKVLNCNSLADCITSQAVRSAPEFPNFLGVVLETLLSYTNDKESDVRMVADECLNRITKVLLGTNLGRLQVEFYKEFKKNGPSRCVRSALWRFAELAPLIRPQKRRPFVVNLLPCIVKMAERHEEALQECLVTSMANICPTLMKFATDSEIKSYASPFLHNLCSTSAAVRRVASTCVTLIIQHSRQPLYFFNWLLLQLLDMVLPIMHVSSSENMPIMLGCLHCVRLTIPYLADLSRTHKKDTEVKADTSIMLFELIIHCIQQSHPSIVTAALECFQQLLKTPLPGFIDLCLTPGSITSSVLAKSYEATLAQCDIPDDITNPEMSVEDTDSTTGIIDDINVNLTIKSADEDGEGATDKVTDEEQTGTAEGRGVQPVLSDTQPSPRVSPDSGDHISDSSGSIGSLTDCSQPPLLYAARLLCHTFLLTGDCSSDRLYPDKEVRVSIKSLAVSCLSHIVLYYPRCFSQPLFIESIGDSQLMSDVLLYHKHPDPQLQGTVALIAGNMIHSNIVSNCGQIISPSDICSHINLLVELLSSDNSITLRLSLTALRHCLNTITTSNYMDYTMNLVQAALKHKNHNYWLVKVELLELLSEVNLLALVWLAGSEIQSLILDGIVFSLITDHDYRVRQSASCTLVKLIPNLFQSEDHPLHSVIFTEARRQIHHFIYPFLLDFPTECPPLIHGLASPYDQATNMRSDLTDEIIQSSLSRVVYTLIDMFSSSSSPYAKLGVCQALYKLSEAYPVTKYCHAWSCAPSINCFKSKLSAPTTSTSSSLRSLMMMDELRVGSGGGPLTLIMSVITSSPLTTDLTVHQDLLYLAGNLLSGACLSALKQGQGKAGVEEKNWPGIYDRLLVPIADKLLTHLCKLLNIFTHVMEDNSPLSATNPKAVLDAAKEALTSPIKKRVASKADTSTDTTEPKTTKEAEKSVKKRKEALGLFNNIPFYMKFYDSIKGAHLNYKVSLNLAKADKFSAMLNCVLSVLGQLLEVASLVDIGKCTEEILEYLKSIVNVSPVTTVSLVHQLLKALFGTNISSQYEELVEKKVISRSADVLASSSSSVINKPGLFTACLSSPYADLAQSLAHNPFRQETDDYHNAIYVIKKCQERKMPSVLKPTSSVDKNTIGAYIRLFEPLVIKSLKMYTLSSSVQLQIQVLNLLVQLIQLRVNYCLLDNDEVFLGYVLKQIDVISEGPPSEQAGLIRCIFQLLLLLSYEKLHSKTLVVVPRIIQLCDGVMASGQDPATHAIPALEMLVKDLFLSRSLSTSTTPDTAFHDIETQREVVLSMLLRLISHRKILGLLSVILYQTMRENEDKWKKMSRQVIDLLLPLITTQQVESETKSGFQSLHNIFLSVSPSVYRPVDMLLTSLFTQPQNLENQILYQRWFSTVLTILRVLLQIGKEEVILSRLNEIEVMFDTNSMTSSSSVMAESYDSLISSSYGTVQPQEVFASFLVQVISFCTRRLYFNIKCAHILEESYSFSIEQLSTLMLYTSHMLQSGHFRKVARFMMEQLYTELSSFHQLVIQINEQMIAIGLWYPTLTVQWCNLLMLLNYDDQTWWKTILMTKQLNKDEMDSVVKRSLNQEIVRSTGLAMYCDYVVENLHDAEHLTWLIVNHVNDIVEHVYEAPVQDLLSVIHGNPSASGLFISAVQSRCKLPSQPSTLRNVLMCLRSIHKDQSGALLVLLVDKLLDSSQACISRMTENLACRRVEVLLAEDLQVVLKELSPSDMMKIIDTLKTKGHKHRRLLSLVNKLQSAFYTDLIEPTVQQQLTTIHKADKEFYLHICRIICSDSVTSPSLCVALLGALENEEILSIMSNPGFQLRCLPDCIRQGYNKSLRIDTGTVISNNEQTESDQELSPLFIACEKTLCELWKALRVQDTAELRASTEDMLASIDVKSEVSVDLVRATCAYLDVWSNFELRLSADCLNAICDLCVSCLTQSTGSPLATSQLFSSIMSRADGRGEGQYQLFNCQLISVLQLLYHILRIPPLVSVFSANGLRVSTVLSSLLAIVQSVTDGECSNDRVAEATSDSPNEMIKKLVAYLTEDNHLNNTKLPPSYISLLRSVIKGMSRIPSLNNCARMPSAEPTDNHSDSCELKADSLQDTMLLKQFIKRNNLLGWISRQQFEETWAGMLHLLSPVATTGAEDISQEEDIENIEWMVSALRGITGHLCLTLRQPQQGNTLNVCYKHVPRHKPIATFHTTRLGHKLHQLRLYLARKTMKSCDCLDQVELLCNNPERRDCKLWYNQLSVDYLTTRISNTYLPELDRVDFEKADVEMTEKGSKSAGTVDSASCLKLLIDVFTQLLSPTANPSTPLMLANECIKSMLVLSDLFSERVQFQWMLLTLIEFYHNHHNGEDELTNQYMVLALCKSAAVIQLDSSHEDKLQKIMETSLRSLHIPSRLAAINGCLLLLESAVDSDLVKNTSSLALDYVSRTLEQLSTKLAVLSEVHSLCFWSLSFYLFEHFLEQIQTIQGFTAKFIQVAVQFVSTSDISTTPSICKAILEGFERLLLTNSLGKAEAAVLLKLAYDRLSLPSTQIPLDSVLGLLITCLYADLSSDSAAGNTTQVDPEVAAHYMEIISLLFDRIRRGLPAEAELVSGVLPPLMADLLSSQDIMNKVIGEFLTEQQSHPALMARMIYEVFEQQQISSGASNLLQDWVLLSLNSFVQRKPLATAIWSLNCCFLCASNNHWLKGLFPFLSARIGMLEQVDEDLFLLSAEDFYNSLTSDNQQKQFLAAIQSAARNEAIYKKALENVKT